MPESDIIGRSTGTRELVPIGKSEWVVTSSATAPWRDWFKVELHKRPAFERPEVIAPTIVALFRGIPKEVSRAEMRIAGVRSQHLFRAGDINLVPEGAPAWVRHLDPTELILICIAPATLAKAAADNPPTQNAFELKHLIGIKDQAIGAIAILLERETRTGCPSGRIYGESLGLALAAHILRLYAVFPPKAMKDKSGLSRPQLRQVTEYISANISAEVGIQDLANLVELSPFHFCRLFKQSTGLAPRQYILQLRIAEAKRLLRSTQLSIAAIANQVGFFDQSHFTMTFRKVVGTTPGSWRSQC